MASGLSPPMVSLLITLVASFRFPWTSKRHALPAGISAAASAWPGKDSLEAHLRCWPLRLFCLSHARTFPPELSRLAIDPDRGSFCKNLATTIGHTDYCAVV